MNKIESIILRVLRKIIGNRDNLYSDERVQYKGQEANDYIYKRLVDSDGRGLLICKFGTIELGTIVCYLNNKRGWSIKDSWKFINWHLGYESTKRSIIELSCNAGFFPCNENLIKDFTDLYIKASSGIDILASYMREEEYIAQCRHAVKVDLEGFYAPFLWIKPWTKYLQGKKVLIVHPFVDTIQKQYAKRELLFENKDVLPDFQSIHFIKAVQSIAGEETEFANWFDALQSMIDKMDRIDYDVAIIGCGAYGLPLAAHAKSCGKIGIQLAGWTQMLFGIYGNRWIKDQPEYNKFINNYWVRPNNKEVPASASKVENGCYW